MFTKQEFSDLIHSDKKRISWNDHQVEGKIEKGFLQVGRASSPSRAVLNKAINKLIVEEGYPEIEATAVVGKSITPSGKLLFNDPILYESTESIKRRISLEKEARVSNRKGFFSMSNIGLGMAVLAVATTIGVVASRK